MHNSQILKKIGGGGNLTASLFCAAATFYMTAATAANLSDIQIIDGTLTVDTAGEWVVNRDVSCTTLAITADSPVTFVNPSESQTNTILSAPSQASQMRTQFSTARYSSPPPTT